MVATYHDLESDDNDDDNADVFSTPHIVADHNDDFDDDDDDDFEDLSDDEKRDVESPPETSLMERIKLSKQQQKQLKEEDALNSSADMDEVVVNTAELDLDKPDYLQLNSVEGDDIKQDTIKDIIVKEPETVIVDDVSIKSDDDINVVTTMKKSDKIDSDSDDGCQDNPYVITGDVDVQDDWMNKSDSENEAAEEEKHIEEDSPKVALSSIVPM